ncbi:hypothetical protein CAI21_09845 [Alkalilimnicola ehrlichii]|uniref:Uncharacterized protein n=1 Tax=Alkalilimnicola ehrlichii TaxID=351052 RepID=A0A3E0WV66_9GAMM|nr:hypothetical protein [Alkalilimnicola ehrlichii]RFA29360.1 hypothetical protein CAI21_09845 [Alkalilimnicola ehrlichii]RFA36874.1 hypothetical protein CAL65_10180 [Alkalilimnicola ehrlichii]
MSNETNLRNQKTSLDKTRKRRPPSLRPVCQRCGAPGFTVELGRDFTVLCEYHYEALELEA